MRHPAPKDHDVLYNWLYQNAGRTPFWEFPETIPGEDLRLERMTFENYQELVSVFADDENPFVEQQFRQLDTLYEYVGYLMAIFPYHGKHGGADYLVYPTGEHLPAGIVHLYDLNIETDKKDRAFIGFQIGSAHRGTSVGHRAVSALEGYALEQRGLERLYATTLIDNIGSINFLLRRGYRRIESEGPHCEFLLTRPG